jgi:hypothetical protein
MLQGLEVDRRAMGPLRPSSQADMEILMTTRWMAAALVLMFQGCGGEPGGSGNPFLQDQSNSGKEDTAYLNPDGIEVEVDLEADVEGSEYQLPDGPAELGQFALTYLRQRGTVYLESLAEDSTSDERAEWLIDGTWLTAAKAKTTPSKMRHFRLRGVNAVLLFGAASGVKVGKVLTARVPQRPFSMMSDNGEACADPDESISLSQSVYWYLYNPDKKGCTAKTQEMKVTVSKKMSSMTKSVYPEYDRLVADKKVTAVILFGQIGHEALDDSDPGVQAFNQMASWLLEGGFAEVKPAPIGRRFSKKLKTGVAVEIDLYSPREFAGLDDYSHFDNFQRALSEHEIVAYDGHSMLGASDFWARPTYPGFYQVFLYGGCLGYEYYVRPILAGKKGWANLDIMSSVVEVSASANEYAAPWLAKLIWSLENGNKASWRDLLLTVRTAVGDSTFGVSGVRNNCYTPTGSRCK